MSRFRASAYAKINLALRIVGRRPDGFHELESIVSGLDWYDRLTAESTDDGVDFHCDQPGLGGRENLACRAAMLLRERFAVAGGVRLRLDKSLDVGAGLGGGSSDAAAALMLCNSLWRIGLERLGLARLGAELGSDVPLFFHLPHAWMTGRGEVVRSIRLAWCGWVVLLRTGLFVSTAEVYRRWRPEDACIDGPERLNLVLKAADAGSMERWAFNDLEAAVFRTVPEMERLRHRLREAGIDRPLRVTGAGSVLVLFEDSKAAAQGTAARVLETGVVRNVSVARVLDTETLDVTEE